MSLPDLSFTLPDLTDTALYPAVTHAASCVDPQPAPSTCFPDPINVVRPFASPTEPLGQLRQPLSRLHDLFPVPPPVGTHCPSPRVDLVEANAGAMTGDEPEVGFRITRPEKDACLPLMTPKLVFPCTSITADSLGAVTMVDDASIAGVTHALTKNDSSRKCSTNVTVSARVPCVVPTISVHSYDSIKPADADSGEGAGYTAAFTVYNAQLAIYATAQTTYLAQLALYTAEMGAYAAAVTAYNAAYATYQLDLVDYYTQMELQPEPDPLPIKPTAPTKPVAPVAPVAPIAPPTPVYTAVDLDDTGDSRISSLVSGSACNRHVRIAVRVSSGAKSGGGFMVGIDCSSTSPFSSDAAVLDPVLPALPVIYPPGAELPIVDVEGIFGDPCTQLDVTKLKVVNHTRRCLAYGDIVSVAYTDQPKDGDRTIVAVVNS